MQKSTEERAGAPAETRSIIGAGVTIRGDVEGACELHLDGRIIGRVAVAGLLVSEKAEIEGPVSAEAVDVSGRVSGPIEAASVHLRATAVVESDITYTSLQVDPGARFSGRASFSDASAAKVVNLTRGEGDGRNEAADELTGMATRLRRAIEPRAAAAT